MKPIIEAAQPLGVNMCVDLGRRDVRVPQHHLNRTQIGSVLEQVSGKTVTQNVW